VRLLAGTSGYSYKPWKGRFYPADLPDGQMLRFYGEHLPAVEVNNTFYRMPAAAVVARWAEETPADFVFALKAPARITHTKKLGETEDALGYFLKVSAVLGHKRGPVLYQLPPYLRKDTERLRRLLEQLPPDSRAAVEFRHPSWFDDAVYELLKERGAALCVSDMAGDDEGGPALPAVLVPTTTWGYLRLRRVGYDGDALRRWADQIRAQPWQEAFVFFKHEDEGQAPALATQLRELAGG
jgi:uncharacterized protein YecE (DUF72 family)